MFGEIRKLFQAAGDEIQQLRRNLETARQQRDLTASAPLTKEDAIAAMHKAIDQRAAAHYKTLAKALANVVRKGEPGRVDVRAVALAKPDFTVTPTTLEDGLSLLLNQQLKDGIARVIEGMEWPAGAMPRAEKTERLRELDGRILKLERDLASAVGAARSAGLSV